MQLINSLFIRVYNMTLREGITYDPVPIHPSLPEHTHSHCFVIIDHMYAFVAGGVKRYSHNMGRTYILDKWKRRALFPTVKP